MACCCFWFIHPASAMTTNWNGFKTFRISAVHYLLTVGQRTKRLCTCRFNQIEFLDATGCRLTATFAAPPGGTAPFLRACFFVAISARHLLDDRPLHPELSI